MHSLGFRLQPCRPQPPATGFPPNGDPLALLPSPKLPSLDITTITITLLFESFLDVKYRVTCFLRISADELRWTQSHVIVQLRQRPWTRRRVCVCAGIGTWSALERTRELSTSRKSQSTPGRHCKCDEDLGRDLSSRRQCRRRRSLPACAQGPHRRLCMDLNTTITVPIHPAAQRGAQRKQIRTALEKPIALRTPVPRAPLHRLQLQRRPASFDSPHNSPHHRPVLRRLFGSM